MNKSEALYSILCTALEKPREANETLPLVLHLYTKKHAWAASKLAAVYGPAIEAYLLRKPKDDIPAGDNYRSMVNIVTVRKHERRVITRIAIEGTKKRHR